MWFFYFSFLGMTMFPTITPAASFAFVMALQQRGKGGGIRLCINTSGCTGLSYSLEFADELAENEELILCGKVRMHVEKNHLHYLNGLVIDYVKQGNEEGFKIHSASLCNSCGCQQSST